MEIPDKNERFSSITYDISTIRGFLQLLAVVNTNDVPQATINDIAGILLKKIESIEQNVESFI